MQLHHKLALISIAAASLAGNFFYAGHLVGEWKATDDLCKKADRYSCGMRAVILDLGVDTPPQPEAEPAPAQSSEADPIGDMVRQFAAQGRPVPPQTGKGS